jgi:ABC-type transport system involved in cytochrome c biogenesis permease subunit
MALVWAATLLAAAAQSAPTIGAGEGLEPRLSPALAEWRAIPVLEDGRLMPLDTFARRQVETITNSQTPRLPTGAGGRVVKWAPDELLLDWLVRPEAWEDVPFLHAEHEELRALLDLPVFATAAGEAQRLKFAAPSDVADSEPLRQRLMQLDDARRAAQAEGRPFRPAGLEAKVEQLWQSYVTWRQLTFRATGDQMGRSRFLRQLDAIASAWRPLGPQLRAGAAAPREAAEAFEKALLDVGESVGQSTRFATADVLPRWEALHASTADLRGAATGASPSVQRAVHRVADRVAVLGEALFDNGGSVAVIPALHASALDAERDADADMPPWLGLATLLDAPPSILAGYPEAPLAQTRAAYQRLASHVRDTTASSLDGAVTAAADLATGLRRLGEGVEPVRRGLAVERVDPDVLAHTSYPPSGSTLREVRYNVSDPFRMSWVLSLAALGAFALAFGAARGPMFWLGTALLVAELAWTAWAFANRVAITGWAPVTNMYETVIYVPFFLSLLGLCFLVAPACGRGVADAWRLTALPPPVGSWLPGEATPLLPRQTALAAPSAWAWGSWLLLLPRLAGSAVVLWVLARAPYAAGGRTIINLLPQTDVDGSIPNLNNLVVWIVGLSMLLPAVWYVPRLLLAGYAALVTVPLSWGGGHLRSTLADVYSRRSFGLVVTAVAFAGTFIAWFFPIPGKQFSPLQPVLRDNFWLTIHVLTIVSSYAAGALAWGLGILALGHYLLGRYPDNGRGGRSAPAACGALAGFIYKAMQVAVLLLAAGTILGGLWADVSWGRFWGWDPKEVWALVSLLAYLIILHGRYAGWIGNFGLAAGSVLGAAVIGMSWYGVNFLLGAGLHSYGFGQGGQTEFFTFLVANLLLLAAAGWRFWREQVRT